MLQKSINKSMHYNTIAISLTFLIVGCGTKNNELVQAQKEKVASQVDIGDNIHEVKVRLIKDGFKIVYGPDFPTEDKSYLMMIIDYGVSPNKFDTFKYTVGLEGSEELIHGVVEATPEGVITNIE